MKYTEIDGWVVENVEMLDKDTCLINFSSKEEEDGNYTIEVEYWLDDDTWHFWDSLFDKDGLYIDGWNSTSLSESGKEKCKELIKEFLSSSETERLSFHRSYE